MATVEVAPKSSGPSDLITAEGTNVFDVCCPRCGSVVLRKNSAKLIERQQSIPVYAKKSELSNPSNEFPTDLITQFWSVHDMYTFENVGFTHSVNSIRYLTCADCELGPIGFQDMAECQPTAYYVALSRTCHGGQSTGGSQ
ncbi:hypothetical protein CRM22_008112 [Opisthorchis felineus]|uniref:Uncharacterized protein n=1 Tax=Opisthorchis felineus TaxID=147828 RepID=A0A4S2LDA9_OPIFE|nr:hypothetical protein CRM22_008112 [Opisthorchis felineus]